MRYPMLGGLLGLLLMISSAMAAELVPVQEGPLPIETKPAAVHPAAEILGADLVPIDEEAPLLLAGGDRSDLPPVAIDDYFTVEAGESSSVTAGQGLLVNDYDPEGDNISINLILDNVDNGTVSATTTGSFIYTPDAGFTGYDSFQIRITDGNGNHDTSWVHLQVVASDRAPVAADDYYNMRAGEVLTVPAEMGLLANDYDPDGDNLAVNLIYGNPENGTISAMITGSFTYTPDAAIAGVDSFNYRMGANGVNAVATVRINVYDPNRAPIATEDHYYVSTEGPLIVNATIGVLRNDYDPDGDDLAVNLIYGSPEHGTISAMANGGFTYTPESGYTGLDGFTYRMTDGNGGMANATVQFFVGIDQEEVSAVEIPAASSQFGMALPAPNPFNPTTRIDFRIDGSAHTTLRIYDVRGSLVRTLVNESLAPGEHSVQWDGRNESGAAVASGTYFAALSSGAHQTSRRLALVK